MKTLTIRRHDTAIQKLYINPLRKAETFDKKRIRFTNLARLEQSEVLRAEYYKQAIFCNNKYLEYSLKAQTGLVFYQNIITNLN